MEKLAKFIYFAIIVVLLYFTFPFFLPFIIALILAILFEPLVLFVQDKVKIKRVWSVTLVFTTFFAFVFWLIYISASKLVKEAFALSKALPGLIEKITSGDSVFTTFYNSFSAENQTYIKNTFFNLIGKVTEFLTSYAGSFFTVIKAFPAYFVAFIVFMVAVYIIAIELPTLRIAFLKYFEKGQSQKKIEIVMDKLKVAIVGFLRAQLIFSTLTFIICVIGLNIIGINFVVLFSLLIVIVDLLPILGTGSVLVPWAVYLGVTGEIYQAVGLLILFLVITVFRRIIEPKLLGDSIGLKPLPTLISMYVGFEVMGIMGMIIGPAIMIVVQALEDAELLRVRIKL